MVDVLSNFALNFNLRRYFMNPSNYFGPTYTTNGGTYHTGWSKCTAGAYFNSLFSSL